MKRWIVGILIAVVVIGGVTYWLSQQKLDMPFAVKGKVVAAEQKTLTIPIKATGLIEPAVPPIEIKSKASGEVQKILVKAGDLIQKGQLLLALDPKDEDRAVERAKAQMDQSEAMWQKSKVAEKQLEEDHPEDVRIAEAVLAKSKALLEQNGWALDKLEKANKEGGADAYELKTQGLLVQQMEADFKQMQAQLEKVKHSDLQIEAAKEQVKLDFATFEAAKKSWEDEVQRRKECSIYSPITGMVSKINVRVGEMIQSGTTSLTGGTMLMTLADISDLYVTAQVDEADISSVLDLAPAEARPGVQRVEAVLKQDLTASAAKGQSEAALVRALSTEPAASQPSLSLPGGVKQGKPVKITVEAYRGEEFEGQIEHISPEPLRQQSVVTYDVRIRLTSPNRYKLLLGMQADTEFTSQSVDAVVVPVDAVKILDGDSGKGERGVWVPTDEDKALPGKKWQPCRFGLDDGINIEVLKGLKVGDKVYTQLPVDLNANKQ